MPTLAPAVSRQWSVRLALVCFMAASVSLPIVWISLAKVLLVVVGAVYLALDIVRHPGRLRWCRLWTPRIILLSLLALGLSLLWTSADLDVAGLVLVKHLKLLEIVMLLALIRTVQEARSAVLAFGLGQAFLLLSSWALFAGIPIPWTTDPIGKYVVFSSYLDQSIILATSAAVFWHLRAEGLWPRGWAVALAALAVANALLLMTGRTGYLVALAVLALAAMWAMPKRWRLLTLLVAPVLVLTALFLGSAQVQTRVAKIVTEGQTYSAQGYQAPKVGEEMSSTGWRLRVWGDSLRAVAQRPWLGHGVGAWTNAVRSLEGEQANEVIGTGKVSNPHEEFLLWGVQLGVGGTLLLLGLFAALWWDSRAYAAPVRQALLSVLVATLIACLFNSALYDDLMGDFLCVALGLLLALGRHRTTPLPTTPAYDTAGTRPPP